MPGSATRTPWTTTLWRPGAHERARAALRAPRARLWPQHHEGAPAGVLCVARDRPGLGRLPRPLPLPPLGALRARRGPTGGGDLVAGVGEWARLRNPARRRLPPRVAVYVPVAGSARHQNRAERALGGQMPNERGVS